MSSCRGNSMASILQMCVSFRTSGSHLQPSQFRFLGNCLYSFQPGHPETTNTQPEHPGAKGNFERGERLGLVILLEKNLKELLVTSWI